MSMSTTTPDPDKPETEQNVPKAPTAEPAEPAVTDRDVAAAEEPVESSTPREAPTMRQDAPNVASLGDFARFIKKTVDESGIDALYDANRDFDAYWHVADARSADESRMLKELSRQTKAGFVGPILASVRPDSTSVEFNNAVQSLLVFGAREDAESDVDAGDGSAADHPDRQAIANIVAALFLAGGADSDTVTGLMTQIDEENSLAVAKGVDPYGMCDGSFADKSFGRPGSRWYQHDYTSALRAYSSVGSVWLDGDRRANVLKIYQQRMDNRATIRYALILSVLFIAFMVLFHSGLFTGSPHVLMIVLCVILLVGVAAFIVWWFRKRPYNNFNGVIGLIYAVWVVYALSVVLW